MSVCCPCDELKHPPQPDIPAGLASLPRQAAGFPEYRLAMLRDIPSYAALRQWRARGGDDLGIMLIEMWAYVLDVLGFYDERIANESYLRTAQLRPSLRKLTELIGYLPRPALAAAVELAAMADGAKAVTLLPGTAFRSDAFDDEPPQIFETDTPFTIHPLTNRWRLGPVRERSWGGELLFESGTAALTKGQIVVFRWPEGGKTKLGAGWVVTSGRTKALDGLSYLQLSLSPEVMIGSSVQAADIQVLRPTWSAHPSLYAAKPASEREIVLDGFYPGLARDQVIVIQKGKSLLAAVIKDVWQVKVPVASIPSGQTTAKPTIPVSKIGFDHELQDDWWKHPEALVIHLEMIDVGELTRPAKTHLSASDFASPGAPIEGLVEPLPESGPKPSRFLLKDAAENGVSAQGTVEISDKGSGSIVLAEDTKPFSPSLRTPVEVFGNVVMASRGESVFNEVLGSGDAGQTFQSFTLANKPLTYFNDASAPRGRRNTLEVRVNGIVWEEATSFYGKGPDDEIYVVRENDEQESTITFGDGCRGARLPTGVDNVTATYRHGAGAAKPPAGAIGQLAKPVQGLGRVVNPVAAGGGADADRPRDIRTNAPAGALILGRAVSLPDFEALALEFGGVVNAQAEWIWDETFQGAVAKIWFISDGDHIADPLRAYLIGMAEPSTPLVAEKAKAQPSLANPQLVIDLLIHERFNPDRVALQAHQALTNKKNGILALQNIPIGGPLFRSRIFAVVLGVQGVLAVRGMTVDGKPAPFAINAEQGRYRDFISSMRISAATAAASDTKTTLR